MDRYILFVIWSPKSRTPIIDEFLCYENKCHHLSGKHNNIMNNQNPEHIIN